MIRNDFDNFPTKQILMTKTKTKVKTNAVRNPQSPGILCNSFLLSLAEQSRFQVFSAFKMATDPGNEVASGIYYALTTI